MSLPHQPRAKLDSQYNHLDVGISKPIVQFMEEFGTYFFSRIRILCDLSKTYSNHGSFSHEDVS
jgi:hypothetical protein